LPESLFSEGKIASPCGDENIESTRDNLAKYRKWLDSLEAKYSINILNWLIPSAYAQNKGNDGVFRAQGKSNLLGLNLTRTLQVQTNIGATCGHDFNEVVAELPNCEGGCTDEQMKALVAKLDRIFARTSTLKEGSDEAVKVAEEYQEIERKKPSDAQQFSDSPKTLVAKVENQQNLKNNNKQDGDDQDNSGKEFGYSYSNTPIRDSGSNAGAEQQSQNENGRGEAVVTLARQTNDELSHMARTQEQTLERIKENIRQGKRPDEGLKKMTNEELSFGRMKRMSAVLQLANGEKKFLLQEEILDKEGNVKEVIKKEPDFSDYVDYSNVDVSKRATVMATDIMTEARMRGMNFPANEVVKVANKLAQKDETSKVSMDEIFGDAPKIADPGKESEMRNLMAQKVAEQQKMNDLQDEIKAKKHQNRLAQLDEKAKKLASGSKVISSKIDDLEKKIENNDTSNVNRTIASDNSSPVSNSKDNFVGPQPKYSGTNTVASNGRANNFGASSLGGGSTGSSGGGSSAPSLTPGKKVYEDKESQTVKELDLVKEREYFPMEGKNMVLDSKDLKSIDGLDDKEIAKYVQKIDPDNVFFVHQGTRYRADDRNIPAPIKKTKLYKYLESIGKTWRTKKK
jgi:copper chaperone CopZ